MIKQKLLQRSDKDPVECGFLLCDTGSTTHDFEWAKGRLKEGFAVTRISWPDYHFLVMVVDIFCDICVAELSRPEGSKSWTPTKEDVEATDWIPENPTFGGDVNE